MTSLVLGLSPMFAKRIAPRQVAPIDAKRASLRRLRADLTRAMYAFLQDKGAKIVGQIQVLRSVHAANAAAVIDGIDFSSWATLVPIASPLLSEAALDGSVSALDQLDDAGMQKLREAKRRHREWRFQKPNEAIDREINSAALAYGRERAAAMVGMRFDELGRLVPNPNAIWQITASTRDMLRADIEQAIAEGWSNNALAEKIAESYGFSKNRATVIARTETNRASNAGALAGYRASGVVTRKGWLTANDGNVTPECDANQEAGAINIDANFPSGEQAPPAHPNCRCTIVPVVDWTAIDNIPDTIRSKP